jgi:hypothetical protein
VPLLMKHVLNVLHQAYVGAISGGIVHPTAACRACEHHGPHPDIPIIESGTEPICYD